jgi:penicillin G amidase
LRAWDRRYDPDSHGAALFERCYGQLVAEVFGGALGNDVVRSLAAATSILTGFYAAFDSVLLDERSAWFGADGRDAVFRRVAAKALRDPAPTWGTRQRFRMRHLLLGGRFPFSRLGLTTDRSRCAADGRRSTRARSSGSPAASRPGRPPTA